MTTDGYPKYNEFGLTDEQTEKHKAAAEDYAKWQQEQLAEPIDGLYTLIKKTHLEDGTTEIQVSKDESFLGLTLRVATGFADQILVNDKIRVDRDLEVHLP